MARRKRVRRDPDERLSPYPHHPRKPGIYVLYIDWPGKDTSCVCIYAEAFGAKKHLDMLLEGLERKVIKDDDLKGIVDDKQWLVADNGIRIKCSRLQEILDYECTPEEDAWQFNEQRRREIELFRYGKSITPSPSSQLESESPQDLKKKERRTKRRREKQPSTGSKAPRQTPDGMITVAMMAESLNILPREARARLRKAKIAKPDSGWMWSEAEADEIKELIANG